MKQSDNLRIVNALLLNQRTSLDICLIIKTSLMRIENNSLEWALLLL